VFVDVVDSDSVAFGFEGGNCGRLERTRTAPRGFKNHNSRFRVVSEELWVGESETSLPFNEASLTLAVMKLISQTSFGFNAGKSRETK